MCSSASIFLTWNDYFSILHTKTTMHHFAHSPLALALTSHPLISYLISFYSARITSYYVLLATLAHSPLLVSASRHERFSHAYASLACMYTLHACSASCFHYRTCFPLRFTLTSSRASWLHALTSYHTLHYCSVPVQRTSRQSWLCRCLATSAQHPLPVMSTLHMLYKLSYRIREWISDELRSHRGHREQHLCSVFVEDMRRGEEGFKNVACVGRGKKPSHVKVL